MDEIQAPVIRLLTATDGPAYQALRLQSLQESPQAFLSTYDAEKNLQEKSFANQLDWAYHPPHHGYFGIFMGKELAGYLQIGKSYLEKQNHIVFAYNFYIAPQYRRQGVATKLFQYVLNLVAASEQIERVYLTCAATNVPACNFYKKMGFRRFSIRAKTIKWQGVYDDEVEMVKVL